MSQENGQAKNVKIKSKNFYTEKVFVIRESYHTTLRKDNNIKSIYHMCIAIFLIVLLENVANDFLASGRIYLGLKTIKNGFGNFTVALAVWSLMHLPVIGLYFALKMWSQVLEYLKIWFPFAQNLWNLFCIISLIGFQSALLYYGTMTCLTYQLPFGSASALLIETFRLMMKSHAFVRTNVPKLLANGSNKSKDNTFQLSSIKPYIYYLFAPTFIYRDSYPRTNRIRWTFVFQHFVECVSIIFLVSFLYEGHILKTYKDYGLKKETTIELTTKFFGMILPSNLIFLSGNYMVIHSWLNLTGEILRFGDRMYYKDWWTSSSFKTYYRLWNIVVHEWFYEYLYKDVYKYICKGSEIKASLAVIYMSTFVHEYVVSISLMMFYPLVCLCYGGSGVAVFFISHYLPETIGKIFVWISFLVGSTVLITFYSMAYFAKVNGTYK